MTPRTAIAATAVLGLAACGYVDFSFGGSDDGANSSAANTGNATATDVENRTQAADAGVTRSRSLQPLTGGGKDPAGLAGPIVPATLVGAWGDNGNCSNPTELFADGTFRAPDGGQGAWRLEGDLLVATGPGGTATMRLTSVTRGEIVGLDAQGNLGRSVRC